MLPQKPPYALTAIDKQKVHLLRSATRKMFALIVFGQSIALVGSGFIGDATMMTHSFIMWHTECFLLYFSIVSLIYVFAPAIINRFAIKAKASNPTVEETQVSPPKVYPDQYGYVTCPYCGHLHRHGGAGNGIASGYRQPDCGNQIGYVLVPHPNAKK